MTPDNSPFDLDSWVRDSMPELVAAEADAETWRAGFGEGREVAQPVSDLVAEGSPLRAYLDTPDRHPEGASRAEQAEFYAARDTAREAAEQAARDAAQDHARWVETQRMRATADALDALMARAATAKAERESGSGKVPVRDAGRPPEYGRW